MKKLKCPCCGYYTLNEESGGNYVICSVCYWENDPIQLDDPDDASGANRVSLNEGRKNYVSFGACEKEMIQYVRKPLKEEMSGTDSQSI